MINKKVRRKRMFRTRNWLMLHVKQYKKCCWRSYFIRECIATYLHSTLLDYHDEVAIVATYHQQANYLVQLSQQTNEQTKVIQEVRPPEVSNLNHVVMNQKQEDQMQFSLEKRLEKKLIHPTHQHHTIRWIVL